MHQTAGTRWRTHGRRTPRRSYGRPCKSTPFPADSLNSSQIGDLDWLWSRLSACKHRDSGHDKWLERAYHATVVTLSTVQQVCIVSLKLMLVKGQDSSTIVPWGQCQNYLLPCPSSGILWYAGYDGASDGHGCRLWNGSPWQARQEV